MAKVPKFNYQIYNNKFAKKRRGKKIILFCVKFFENKYFLIYFIFFIISAFSILNLQNKEDLIIDKVNLGLDLQGGSYLLLEINTDTLVKEKIQSKVIPVKKLLKENNINYSDFKIKKKTLSFKIDDYEKFDLIFFSKKDNLVNPYIDLYRSYELQYKKIIILLRFYFQSMVY